MKCHAKMSRLCPRNMNNPGKLWAIFTRNLCVCVTREGVWLFVLCCVSVAIPATVLPWCLGCLLHWLSICGPGWAAMATTHSDGVRGSLDRSVRSKFWQVPSQLMGGRNGSANSLPGLIGGRGGVVGFATTTSRQACGASAGRRLRRVHGLFFKWR